MKHRTIAQYRLAGWLAIGVISTMTLTSGAEFDSVLPLLDNQTYAVLAVDSDHINIKATLDKALEWMSQNNLDDAPAAEMTNEVAATRAFLEKWNQDFRQAGGRKVYALAHAQDGLQFVLAIPLTKDGNRKALASLMEPLLKNTPFASFDKQMKGEWLLMGKTEVLARMISAKPVERKDLAQALEAMAGGGIGIAVAPASDQKRVIQEMLPQIPIGAIQVPTASIIKALSWVSLDLGFPPETHIKLTAQTSSETDAKELNETVGKVLKSLSSLVDDAPAKIMVDALNSKLTTRRDQNRLTFNLDKTALEQVIMEQLLPSLAKAKIKSQAIYKMNHAKQIVLGCLMFQNDNKKWPANLKLLTPYIGSAEVLKTPDHPEREVGFEYLIPGQGHGKYPASQHILIHEIFSAWPNTGLCIGFLDGHAEIMKDKSRFDQLLSETKARNRAE